MQKQTDQVQVCSDWKVKIDAEMNKAFGGQLATALGTLRRRMNEFAVSGECKEVHVRTLHAENRPGGHHTQTRYQLDRRRVRSISRYLHGFRGSVKRAADLAYPSPDGQRLAIDKVERVLEHVGEDVMKHAADIKDALLRANRNFTEDRTYRELIGSMSMLKHDIHAIRFYMTKHLSGIIAKSCLEEARRMD